MTIGTLSELGRWPRRSRLIIVASAALLAGLIAWYIGMETWRAVGVVVLIVAVGVSWIAVPEHATIAWPEPALRAADGVRHDVLDLSWLLRSRGRGVRDAAVVRLRAVARARLSARHLDLDKPGDRQRVEQLIGAAAYQTLRPPTARTPSLRAVVHSLDMLDRMDRMDRMDGIAPDRPGVPDQRIQNEADRTNRRSGR